MMILLMIAHVCLYNIDEHLFNKKRDHSRYEILSTISDGVLFLLPILMATFVSFDADKTWIYKTLAAISMLSIIKNECFYQNLEVKERLIHACLYVLHPIILFNFFESWQNHYFQTHPNFWMVQLVYLGFGIKSFTYQLIYWNYIHEPVNKN
jgi:hypothetical protein